MSSKGKTKLSRVMEHLKNHNRSLLHLSDSSRSGTKCSHSGLSHHSKTMTSSRRQGSNDSSSVPVGHGVSFSPVREL